MEGNSQILEFGKESEEGQRFLDSTDEETEERADSGKSLKFRRLCLENWRNFPSVNIAIQDRMFLVGQNASGKSNLLDAFRFLRDLAVPGGGFHQAVTDRGGVGAMRSLSARRHSEIEITASLEDENTGETWEYSLAFNQDINRTPQVKKELVTLGGKILLERPNDQDKNDPDLLKQTHLEQSIVNKEFRKIVEFFKTIHYSHVVPQLVRNPSLLSGAAIEPYGEDLLEQMARTQEKTLNSRLGRIKEAISLVGPQLEELELVIESATTPHLRGKYKHWRSQGVWHTEKQFSDGTLRLIGLLWALMERKGPLLLEEPEISLHASAVRELPQLLAATQFKNGRQIFISTHSGDMFHDSDIALDEVLILRHFKEGSIIEQASLDKIDYEKQDSDMPLSDIIIPLTEAKLVTQLSLIWEG